MTPLEEMLLRTPRPTRCEAMRAEITTLRNGLRRLVQARVPVDLVVGQVEQLYFEFALEECGGNRSHAAVLVGKHRNTLTRRLPLRAKKPAQPVTVAEQNWKAGAQ